MFVMIYFCGCVDTFLRRGELFYSKVNCSLLSFFLPVYSAVCQFQPVSPSSVDAGRSYLKCSHVYLVLKHMRVTHSVINCFGKPAPVLRLSPHSLVYSGTVSLNQPPLSLSLSLASFRCLSTSLSLAACPLSPILCLSLPVRRWGEYLLPSRLGTRAYPHMHVCGPSGSLV